MPAEWPFSAAPETITLVTRPIFGGDEIAFAYHDWGEDGWQFLPNRPTTTSEAMLVSLREVYERDHSIAEIADLPNGWMASRSGPGAPWERRRNHPFPVFAEDGFYLENAAIYEQFDSQRFRIPTSAERSVLNVGENVKLIFRFAGESAPRMDNDAERMWVEIIEVDREEMRYKGVLRNDPALHTAIAYGRALWFDPDHVFDIESWSSE
jgi:hypothetical protein